MGEWARHTAILGLGAVLLLPSQCVMRTSAAVGSDSRIVERSVSMGAPAAFVIEDEQALALAQQVDDRSERNE